MNSFPYSGFAIYFGGRSLGLFEGESRSLEEDATPDNMPTLGTQNRIFEVGEELTFDGADNDETFLGTSTVDGVLVVATLQPNGDVFFYAPASVSINSITFPQLVSDVTINAEDFKVCYAADIRIATPDGEQPVETLTIGGPILTASGEVIPVKWIGVQTVST